MKAKESMLHIAASSDISVLLLGESGSGKEVAARFIHAHSERCGNPFVALNCGAIANSLAESILEGHCKGAFTGATEEHSGVVRAAAGGTLFLDEIGEMPLAMQCKLLRILQERTVLPLGCSKAVPVDFRLICATNRDLRAEVMAGRFREDLYFRLDVFPIRIPPLRERTDFAEIAEDLWQNIHKMQKLPSDEYAQQGHSEEPKLSQHEIALLANRDWPGNVRQLKNVLQRYALLKPYEVSLSVILKEEFDGISKTGSMGYAGVREKPRHYTVSPRWELICSELSRNEGNRSITAQKLGISRGCLNYQIKKHSRT